LAGILIAATAPLLLAAPQQTLPALPAEPGAASRRTFVPPGDGKLTADQVKMYITVRRLAATLAKPDTDASNPLAQIARLVTTLNSESTAVTQVGADLDEYRWVSLQVSESSERPAGAAPPVGDELLKAIAAAASKAREGLGPAGGAPAAPAESAAAAAERLAYNRQLLSRFKAELDALPPR
jgi:hypothetical protein